MRQLLFARRLLIVPLAINVFAERNNRRNRGTTEVEANRADRFAGALVKIPNAGFPR